MAGVDGKLVTVLDKEAVGARIAHYRDLRRLSQKEVAHRCQVALRQYQRWEYGESVPYRRNLELLATALGVEDHQILGLGENGDAPQGLEERLDEMDRKLDRIIEALRI